MLDQLMSKEKADLITNFRLSNQTKPSEDMVSFHSLLDEEFLKSYLVEIKLVFQTDNTFVAASQLLKRIGFLFTIPALYTMTNYNKMIAMDLKKCYLVPTYKNDKWLPDLFIEDMTLDGMDPHSRREVGKYVTSLFQNISP